MKKFITVVMTAMCMTFAGAMTANAAENAGIGDTNGDGLINSADASEILSFYADVSVGKEPTDDEKFMGVSDINNDGIINSSDASHVLEYYGYTSTIPENETPKGIREYLKVPENKPPVTTKPSASATTATKATTKTTTVKTTVSVDLSGVVTTIPTTPDAEPPATTEIVNCVLAPEGLYPGEKGTIEYIVNTAELKPHDDIPLYNIKEDNKYGGLHYKSRTYYLTDDTKKILNDFAKEHFTEDMTNYDRLKYTWNWLHFNVDYASSWEAYSKISELSFSEASFVHKSGQCIQYNGAFAEMMAYMGYDVYMLEKWNGANCTNQHFMSEVNIGGIGYNTEVGERSYDSPPRYYWMWLFESKKQEFFGEQVDTSKLKIKDEING